MKILFCPCQEEQTDVQSKFCCFFIWRFARRVFKEHKSKHVILKNQFIVRPRASWSGITNQLVDWCDTRARRRLLRKLSCCTCTLRRLKAYRDVKSSCPYTPLLTRSITICSDAKPSTLMHQKGPLRFVPTLSRIRRWNQLMRVCVFYSSDMGLDVGVCVRERGGEGRAGVWFSGRVWLLSEQLLIGSFPLLELCRRQLGIGQQPVNQR